LISRHVALAWEDLGEGEAAAMALYGAARSAGEYVIASADRPAAVAAASETVDLLMLGLRPVP
jgi:hypothetical protein